ncbi:MAG: Prepilin peptidase [Candidatus Magasanikbacteria bacterium GW2011_GWD2_43_18]|nr:MAG: Prepilin peptidase [Candidatus Magasanikbacteria bacterium GW2011_GWD2_43_18]
MAVGYVFDHRSSCWCRFFSVAISYFQRNVDWWGRYSTWYVYGRLVAIFFAYVGGALFVLPFLMLGKKKMASRVPFGTYLTIATAVTMFYGADILSWYIGLIS